MRKQLQAGTLFAGPGSPCANARVESGGKPAPSADAQGAWFLHTPYGVRTKNLLVRGLRFQVRCRAGQAQRRSRVRRRVLSVSLFVALLGAACGNDTRPGPRPAAEEGGAPSKPDTEKVDPCRTPNEGCPCDTPDEVVDCGTVKKRAGDYVWCAEGERTCDGETWGPCVAATTTLKQAPTPQGPAFRLLGLGSTVDCTEENPCDPYCRAVADDTVDVEDDPDDTVAVTDDGVTLTQSGSSSGSACDILEVSPLSATLAIAGFSATAPYTVTGPNTVQFTANLAPCGLTPDVVWAVDRHDVATISNTGLLTVAKPVAGPIHVTAYAGAMDPSEPATVDVTVSLVAEDSPPGAAGTAKAAFAGSSSGTDNAKVIYPYDNTVMPLGLTAPLLQWSLGTSPAAAGGVKVTLRYPATGTPIFSYGIVTAESRQLDLKSRPADAPVWLAAGPRYQIPQAAWVAFQQTVNKNRTTLGDTGVIMLQRRTDTSGTSATPLVELKTALSATDPLAAAPRIIVASGQLKGTVYYHTYGTKHVTNSGSMTIWEPGGAKFGCATMSIRLSDSYRTAAAGWSTSDTKGCTVCHTASPATSARARTDGVTLVTGESGAYWNWRYFNMASTSLPSATAGSSQYIITNNQSHRPPAHTGDNIDEGRYMWGAIHPDGSFLFGHSGPTPCVWRIDGNNAGCESPGDATEGNYAANAAELTAQVTGASTGYLAVAPGGLKGSPWIDTNGDGKKDASPTNRLYALKPNLTEFGRPATEFGYDVTPTDLFPTSMFPAGAGYYGNGDGLCDKATETCAQSGGDGLCTAGENCYKRGSTTTTVTYANCSTTTAANYCQEKVTPFRAAMPVFSPEGDRLAFNHWSGSAIDTGGTTRTGDKRKIALLDFSRDTRRFSNFRRATTGTVSPNTDVWPSFLPGGAGVVFERETVNNSTIAGTTHSDFGGTRSACEGKVASGSVCTDGSLCSSGSRGRLYWVPLSGGAGIELANANGTVETGHLTAGTAASDCGHSPTVEPELNYEPTASTETVGGYNWVLFASRRRYGNVATINPWWSDPRYAPNADRATTKKLWVTALDANATSGDPSHPAFYLPGQEYLAGNGRAFWVAEACVTASATRSSTTLCDSDLDCCGGGTTAYCYVNPDDISQSHCMPGLTCATPPCCFDDGEDEDCRTSADCCRVGDGSFCNDEHRCEAPPPALIYADGTYTRDFESGCDEGQLATWQMFQWKADVPDGTSIDFKAASANDEDALDLLDASDEANIGTAEPPGSANWDDDGINIDEALRDEGQASGSLLRVKMYLHASDDGQSAPLLTDWQVIYNCKDGV